jgi:putative serine protease PepD
MTASKILAVGAASFLLLAGGATAAHELSDNSSSPSAPRTTAAAPASRNNVSDDPSARNVYDHAKNAVAYVSSTLAQGQATGSGFVVASDGLVVTNDHVIDGASQITVRIGPDGAERQAQLVGVDASHDLALLKVDTGGSKLTTLPLADSGTVQVGDPTYAIGSPFGLASTLTTGIVSALHRDLQSPNGATISGVIQTDAAINPGNSGGPLLDANGQVIGVNSQIASGSQNGEGGNVGIGFAVPSNTVSDFLAAVKAGKDQPQAQSQDQQSQEQQQLQQQQQQQQEDPYGQDEQQQQDPYGQQVDPYDQAPADPYQGF